MKKTKKILALEALRGIAFIAVVIHHSGLKSKLNYGGGAWAVCTFFILSGFVQYISQKNKPLMEPSVKNNLKIAIRKIGLIYPLYFLTFISFVPFEFVGNDTETVSNVIIRVFLNCFLIQEYLPIRLNSYNSPSWFLCTLLLSYFVFPWIYKRIKNNYSVKKALLSIFILYASQIVIGIIGYCLPRPTYHKNMLVLYDIVYWFVYRFPLSRLLDIVVGYNLGYLYLENKNAIITQATLKEFILIAVSIIIMIIGGTAKPEVVYKAEIPNINYNQWWSYVIIYTPISALLIWLFAHEQGRISRFLTNKITLYLARISSYGFLIHSVVFNYLGKTINFLYRSSDAIQRFMFNYGWCLNLSVGLIITILCGELWAKLDSRFLKKSS